MLAVFELHILSLHELEKQRTWGWGDHVLKIQNTKKEVAGRICCDV